MECESFMATRSLPKSWAAMTFAHADRASGSRNAACGQGAFDGVNRDHYFQGMNKALLGGKSGRAFNCTKKANMLTRRSFLRSSLAAGLGLFAPRFDRALASPISPDRVAIFNGPAEPKARWIDRLAKVLIAVTNRAIFAG